jgi:TatD DNase family protein
MIVSPAYIDIHTHRHQAIPDVIALWNKYEHFDRLEKGQTYSLGVHPWYINDADLQLQQLESHVSAPEVLALGECGLDALCTTDMALQKKVFARQVQLANQYRKPLIIHCVRAFPETLSLLKDAEVPVIFHGFNNKQALAESVLDQGHYLSFGKAVLNPASVAAAILATVPADRFFLETDDAQSTDIKEIYHTASFIRKTGQDAIILQLQKNFQKVLHT